MADNVISPPLAGGSYDITATATDLAGNVGHDGTHNELMIAASISKVTGPCESDEGQVDTFTCVAADPDNGAITYSWNFGDGTPIRTGHDLATDHARLRRRRDV